MHRRLRRPAMHQSSGRAACALWTLSCQSVSVASRSRPGTPRRAPSSAGPRSSPSRAALGSIEMRRGRSGVALAIIALIRRRVLGLSAHQRCPREEFAGSEPLRPGCGAHGGPARRNPPRIAPWPSQRAIGALGLIARTASQYRYPSPPLQRSSARVGSTATEHCRNAALPFPAPCQVHQGRRAGTALTEGSVPRSR